jgi:hypothetical protein
MSTEDPWMPSYDFVHLLFDVFIPFLSSKVYDEMTAGLFCMVFFTAFPLRLGLPDP